MGRLPGGDIVGVFAEVEQMLVRGLRWATADREEMPAADPAESEAILKAIADLAPRRGGAAERIEVGGTVVRRVGRPVVLSRVTRTCATRACAES